jgi:hypothetical protein
VSESTGVPQEFYPVKLTDGIVSEIGEVLYRGDQSTAKAEMKKSVHDRLSAIRSQYPDSVREKTPFPSIQPK